MPDPVTYINVVPINGGVTTCILGFLLVCLVLPGMVRNKTQYYAALAFVIAIILLHALALMIKTAGFQVFTGAATGLLQAGAILLIVLSVGGLRLRELAGDLKEAYEVIRRGEQDKQVIIPLRGGLHATGDRPVGTHRPASTGDEPVVYKIDPETGEDVVDRTEEPPARP